MDNFDDRKQSGSQSPNNSFPQQSSDFGTNQFADQGQFPQFGETPAASIDDIRAKIESSKSNGWGSQFSGFLANNKKRLLVLIAIIALFGASSYLSNQNEQSQIGQGSASIADKDEDNSSNDDPESETMSLGDDSSSESSASEPEESSEPLDIQLSDDGQVVINGESQGDQGGDNTQITSSDIQEPATDPVAMESDESITITANSGEGITHLARLALHRHVAAQGIGLSNEQKIYAEDYIQNRTGSEMLEVGQKITFSKSIVREAVKSAQGLTGWQIENLRQYTTRASLL
jgi:hypothetical protein